ncbi:MAG: hypothetical protein LBB67_06615 [Oscillospiraceae bacterium]|jgi:hypothetical protein|nr:hypothetical protein [Oscillospiraceae bacterium]
MRIIAVFVGSIAGVANFLWLRAAVGAILDGKLRGVLRMLAGIACPVLALLLCAFLRPTLLPWVGCAAAGTLVLLAILRIVIKK